MIVEQRVFDRAWRKRISRSHFNNNGNLVEQQFDYLSFMFRSIILKLDWRKFKAFCAGKI